MKSMTPILVLLASLAAFVASMLVILSLINLKSKNEAERQEWFMVLKVMGGTIAFVLLIYLLSH